MTEQGSVTVEATGETVGEAKWAALRELEQRVPGLDRESVRFQVVSEGERGLLGVGFTPAHVIASAESAAADRARCHSTGATRRGPPARSSSGSQRASVSMSQCPLRSGRVASP